MHIVNPTLPSVSTQFVIFGHNHLHQAELEQEIGQTASAQQS